MTMTVDYNTNLIGVSCIDSQDGLAEIVKRVVWEVSFFDTQHPDLQSVGTVETFLDTDGLASETYVAFTNVTKGQIIAWALAEQGGNDFLDSLLEGGHAANVENLVRCAALTEKDISVISDVH